MSIKRLNPYVHYNGTAEQAIQLYERALGATVETIQRYSDVPGMKLPAELTSRIIHAVLRVGEHVIMVSDTTPDREVATGSNVQISLDFDDVADMTARFEALAAGGAITVPINDTFWGAKFGMVTDAHGVRWLFNCQMQS
jgi:PhnB protein